MPINSNPKVMLVAGEASGDIHGAYLVKELKKIIPEVECFGLGGEKMKSVGVTLHNHVSELSVVGLIEVIKHYPRLYKILSRMRSLLYSKKPDLLVLIDSPDFNLPIAKTAKRSGIKILYFVSPQIWAWRKSRINIIRDCVDMMAVLFPFEVKFYKNSGVKAKYVGHPLTKDAVATVTKNEMLKRLKLNSDKKLIGLFPGSRVSEIERNYPVLIKSAEKLTKLHNNLHFITPVANTIDKNFISEFYKNSSINISSTNENIYNIINACDAIAATSGTVTLQITLMKIPMLILYRISPLSYQIFKRIVDFKFAGIANVIADKEISREFIQNNATADNISNELNRLLSDQNYREIMKTEMNNIRSHLSENTDTTNVGELAAELISIS